MNNCIRTGVYALVPDLGVITGDLFYWPQTDTWHIRGIPADENGVPKTLFVRPHLTVAKSTVFQRRESPGYVDAYGIQFLNVSEAMAKYVQPPGLLDGWPLLEETA